MPVAVSGSRAFKSISAGFSFSCGVQTDSTAACWGALVYWQCLHTHPRTHARLTVFIQILSLTPAVVLCAGLGQYGRLGNNAGGADSLTPVAVIGLTNIATISCGGQGHTCALLQNGTATCWGAKDLSLEFPNSLRIRLP